MRNCLSILVFTCCVVRAIGAVPLREAPITAEDREHWAFQPLKRPAVPGLKDEAGWARTPVDAFILQTLERKEIAPQKEAEKSTR